MRHLLLIGLITLSLHATSQDLKATPVKKDKVNYLSFYPELGGNSFALSINAEYAHLFNDERNGIYLRGGGGYIFEGNSVLFEGGYLIGKKRNYLDLGVGYTKAFDNNDDDIFSIRAGYRRMSKNGFYFKLSPMLLTFIYVTGETELLPWAGLSLGYSFPLR